MLNIVISVVSDTYDRVQMSKKEVDLQAKAELLYDYAEFVAIVRKYLPFCLKKSHNKLGFLYCLQIRESSSTDDDWSGKIKATNNLIH